MNDITDHLPANYNIAPSQSVPILGQGEPRRLRLSTWGFPAPWKGAGSLVINARTETVFEKKTFRDHTSVGRCAIPMSGYYEWLTNQVTKREQDVGREKVPYFITANPGSPLWHGEFLVVAGLERRESQSSSCVMLTRVANDSVQSIHDRMPLLLDRHGLDEWLGGATSPNMSVVAAACSARLTSRRVSTRVNSVRNNGARLLEDDTPPSLF
jgi:putative SOS response-associated peptidase YedK